jgi:signal peptidase I
MSIAESKTLNGEVKATTKRKSVVREYAEALLFAVILVLFLRAFVIQAFRIPSGSMKNTLLVGDFLFVNKFLYGPKIPFTEYRLPGIRGPKPGDIIVFTAPIGEENDFIKRCIAVEGQTVEVRSKQFYVDGVAIDEPYVIHSDSHNIGAPRDEMAPFTVPPGHLFMVGDNRDDSHDSRYWGPLSMDRVKGKAIFLYFSWDGERHLPRFNRFFDLVR